MSSWRTTCSLLQIISCHLKTVLHTWQLYHPHHLHHHYFAKLSHLAGDVNDSGQGLRGEGMRTFFIKNELGRPVLVSPSLMPSAGEGMGLGREETTNGTAWIFGREGRRNSEPRNQEVGSLHRTQEGRKKHWEKNSAYLRARPTWVFQLHLEVTSLLLEFLLQKLRGERTVLTPTESQGEGQPPPEPIDSTVMVGIIPSQRANGRSSKRWSTLNSI